MRKETYLLLPVVLLAFIYIASSSASAQQPAQNNPQQAPQHPKLFFRETWKERPSGLEGDPPLTEQYVTNPNLELKLYGPGAKELTPVSRLDPPGTLTYVYSAVTQGNWAVTLRDKNNYVDLTGLAKVRWRFLERGFHALRLVVKLADGTMLVGDYAEYSALDFRETEFYIGDLRWRTLNAAQVVETPNAWKNNVDLSKVDEVGFTDLSRGGGHGTGGCSMVDWIEVYGNPVKHTASDRSAVTGRP